MLVTEFVDFSFHPARSLEHIHSLIRIFAAKTFSLNTIVWTSLYIYFHVLYLYIILIVLTWKSLYGLYTWHLEQYESVRDIADEYACTLYIRYAWIFFMYTRYILVMSIAAWDSNTYACINFQTINDVVFFFITSSSYFACKMVAGWMRTEIIYNLQSNKQWYESYDSLYLHFFAPSF